MLQNMMSRFIRYHGESQLLEQAFRKIGLCWWRSIGEDQALASAGKGFNKRTTNQKDSKPGGNSWGGSGKVFAKKESWKKGRFNEAAAKVKRMFVKCKLLSY